MNIKISTNICKELEDNLAEIIINVSKPSEEINKIIENIQAISNRTETVVGTHENKMYIINTNNVINFYSDGATVYCVTKEGAFRIKKKLYELEESLDNHKFIRISNSCIANIDFIESFDLSYVGDIMIEFKNRKCEKVSKRKIKNVMQFLKQRS